jgi:site-specific DNA recombinase
MPNRRTDNTTGGRAVIYTRVSTEEQAREGLSLEAQEAACLEYCQRHGLQPVKLFVEQGESAKTANRTQLKELVAFCVSDRNISDVVFHKIDRFSRSAEDYLQLRRLLATVGATLRSVTEPIDDTSAGKLMEYLFAGLAEFDNNNRSERTTKGMRQKLERGFWTFPPPLGYMAGRDKQGNKSLVLDPERAELVRWAFERFSTGLYTRQQVLRDVTVRGLRTRKGESVSAQTFEQTLRKPVYAGRVSAWGIDVQGRHQPIVSEESFGKVQMILKGMRPAITPRPRNNEDFPLRHFARCGQCGEPLTGSWSTGRGRKYAYYHCQEGCTRVPKETFEFEFIDLLKKLQPQPEYVALFRKVILDVLRAKQGDAIEAQVALEHKLRDLRSNREKLEKAFVYDKAIDPETYERMRTALLADITLAEMELRDASLETIDAEAVIEFALNVLANASNLWKTASLDHKQRFQQVLFPEGVEYSDGDYRTTATCMLFNGLEAEAIEEEELVALPGIEPGFED